MKGILDVKEIFESHTYKQGNIWYTNLWVIVEVEEDGETLFDKMFVKVELGSGAFLNRNVENWSKKDLREYIDEKYSTTLGLLGICLEQ